MNYHGQLFKKVTHNLLIRSKIQTPVSIGQNAETIASCYLEKQGLILVKRNYRIAAGEIDLIMRDQSVIAFIEVKMRTQNIHGHAIETISAQKRKRIIRTAEHYLMKHNLYDRVGCRFDVVGIDTKTLDITWIKNAFEVEY